MSTQTQTRTMLWPGKSGKQYKYWIHELPPNFKAEPGNYIFAKESSPGKWTPIYIGETDDLSERFDNHHRAECIRRAGATHIHAHTTPNAAARTSEETDLRARWSTSCNRQ